VQKSCQSIQKELNYSFLLLVPLYYYVNKTISFLKLLITLYALCTQFSGAKVGIIFEIEKGCTTKIPISITIFVVYLVPERQNVGRKTVPPPLQRAVGTRYVKEGGKHIGLPLRHKNRTRSYDF
jgi:hypothetical protein